MDNHAEKLLAPLLKSQDNALLKAYHKAHGNLLMGLILISLTSLLSQGVTRVLGHDFGMITLLQTVYRYLNVFSLILIAYELASNSDTSPYNSVLLSLFIFFLSINAFDKIDAHSVLAYPFVMIAPLISQGLIQIMTFIIEKIIPQESKKFPDKINSLISELLVFMISVLLVFVLVHMFKYQFVVLISLYLDVASSIFNLYQSVWVFLIILFLLNYIWYYGFHGDQVLSLWFEPMLIIFTMFNLGKWLGIADHTYIINASFYTAFSGVTGSGITGAIIVNLILKKKKNLAIVKSSMVPAIFNINETVMFGLPIVGNKIFKVPFLLAPIIAGSLAYLATSVGLMKPYMLAVPWYFPIGLKSLIATGGHLPSVLIELGIFLTIVLLYLPATLKYIRELD
ncbi:PTS transporter subunit EIIC [Erysipelothrix urinaevulpis]|uniref:PTS transporter subunit EIIC n=1 Tax=Erysipelothrix urinaevulpis TaxID=2683717 RepID=UPI00135B51B4|nr:PTS transporter subunit EIIC [Erysipelothrix urinaevulpis]